MVYDYIIVGSGPAGLVCAYCLQKKGKRCLIVEKQEIKKEKTCGGFITWSAINLLFSIGINPEELFEKDAVKINNFIINSNGIETIHRYHAGEYGIGLTRLNLENWLEEKVVCLGGKIKRNYNFKELYKEKDKFVINKSYAKNIIIATGARGYIPKNCYDLRNQSFGLSGQIIGKTNLQSDNVYFWNINSKNDYFWAIPNGKSIWNIGIWFEKLPKNPRELFEYYEKQYIKSNFEEYDYVKSVQGCFCGNVDMTKYLEDGCFGIGDFAGVNNSSTGEGIRYAIESAINLSEKLL